MRMNFFVFLFLVFLIIPFIIISCTRSLTALIRPIPQRYTRPDQLTRPISPVTTSPTLTGSSMTGSPTSQSPTTTQDGGRCSEGCCICGAKPIGHLFVLYDRSYRLCRQHLSKVPELVNSARQRIPNAFVTLTIYDPDVITAVAKTFK
jgi:hypothetical protein